MFGMNNKDNETIKQYLRIILTVIFFASITINDVFANEEVNSLIVQTKESHLRARVDRILLKKGCRNSKRVSGKVYIVPQGPDLKAQIEELRKTGLFETIEPNYKLTLDKVTKSAKVNSSSQYYLNEISFTDALNTSKLNEVKVAVLDSGVDANHPGLVGKVEGREGLEYIDLKDNIGHGTQVAGIITANANNKKGITGIAQNVQILSINVADEYGQSDIGTIVQALDEAYTNGAKIIQISLSTAEYSKILETVIKDAQDKGLLIVASSGNSEKEQVRYPAGFNGVIGVGAVNQNKMIESYSTRGEHISLVAPGTEIYTTSVNKSHYKAVTGTSFATPQVSAVAALVWGVNPELTNSEIKEILINSAVDLGKEGKDSEYGYGLLNAKQALELAVTK